MPGVASRHTLRRVRRQLRPWLIPPWATRLAPVPAVRVPLSAATSPSPSRTGQPAHVSLPGVHRVASRLKRRLTGTLHYGHSIDQLDYYLDEFTFRFNRRTSKSRGLLLYRLLQQAVATDPHRYRELTTASLDHDLWP